MNFLDILLLVFFVKGAIDGYSKGLITSAVNVAGVIVSIYTAVFYQQEVVKFLSSNFGFERKIAGIFYNSSAKTLTGSIPAGLLNIKAMVDMAMNAIAFLLLFIAVQLIFTLIEYFIGSIAKSTKMSFLNRICGAFLSVLTIAIWLSVVITAFQPFLSVVTNKSFFDILNNSKILNQLKVIDTIFPNVIKFI
ncbi:MAG: CvpA family protein [Thermovenabulum sp.]|uniref:CvpA family protein n=1 Tax=Thermovenabulum sp. TaxID=3100335 RepID=UPI003C7DDD93